MKPALMIIDMQNDIIDESSPYHYPMAPRIIPNVKELLEFCRRQGIPVIFARYVIKADRSDAEKFEPTDVKACSLGTPGVEIHKSLKPKPGEPVVDRNRHSCFFNSNLGKMLKRLKVDTLILSGVGTNVCVRATALDAYYRDCGLIIVSDCTGAFDKKTHQATLDDLETILYGLQVMRLDELKGYIRGERA